MISASLAVDRHGHGLGLPPHHHHNHHNHPNARAMTFGEPFLLGPTAPPVPSPPEFLRPLPKPGPRYNGTTSSSAHPPVNGCRVVSHSQTPRVSTTTSKYHHDPVPGAVNLTKDELEDSTSHFNTPSSYRFPITQPYYPSHYLYPTHYNPLIHRGSYLQPAPQPPAPTQPHVENFRHQSPPEPSSPGVQRQEFLPPATVTAAATFSPPQSPSVKPGQSVLLAKRFKVPSGKEGSMKHRILTRPADGSPKKRATINPPSFTKGSLIQLANGDLKRVEDMRTEDFISSAEKSEELRLDPSTVVRIEENQGGVLLTLSYGEQRSQVDFETTVENPFFVFGQGWSSCSPERSYQLYGLKCHRLQVGDICISLTPRPTATAVGDHQRPSSTAIPRATSATVDTSFDLPRKRRWSAPEHFSDEETTSPAKKT